MSASLADITLSLNTPSTLPISNVPLSYMAWLVLVNASPYACHAALGGYTFTIPAWYSYPVALRDTNGNAKPGVSLPFSITPYLQTIPGAGFTSILHTELYMVGEDPPQTVPMPLGGGPVDLTVATSLVNTTDPSGTAEIFLIPHGDVDPTGAVVIYNTGKVKLGDNANIGEIDLDSAGDSFVLKASGWIQNDSTNTGLSSMTDTGVFSTGNANHNGAVQITGTTGAALTLNPSVGILVVDSTGTTVVNTGIAGNIVIGNANHNGRIQLDNTSGIADVDLNVGSTVLNGSTSGTATLWQWMRGTLKVTWIKLNNFRNGNTGVQNITLPVAYAAGAAVFRTTNTSPLNALLSGVAQNFGIVTTWAAAGGSVTVQTQLNKFSIADQINAFDTISFLGSQASAFNGLVIIEGA